jgi:hypothetical protein
VLIAFCFTVLPLMLYAQDTAAKPEPVNVWEALLIALTKVAPVILAAVVTPWLTHLLQYLSGTMSRQMRYLLSLLIGALLSASAGAGLGAPAVEVQVDAGLGSVGAAAGQTLKDAPAKPKEAI